MSNDPSVPGQAREEKAMQAALNSVQPGRLLPGEHAAAQAGDQAVVQDDPLLPGETTSTDYVEDAEHWISVYRELLDFKRFMLDGASQRAAAMKTSDARDEIEATDITVARAEAERFARRLAYWRGNLELLKAKRDRQPQ